MARLESAGYRAAWVNEVIGKDALVQVAVLLAATREMVFGTSIANIWVRPAPTMSAGAAQLAQAYPGRFVLGLGVGYPEQAAAVGRSFGSPVVTMRAYLEEMDVPTQPPVPSVAYPRLIAANGPRMLALAGESADGAVPAGQSAERTAAAREALGAGKLLVVGTGPAFAAEHLAAGADHVLVMLDRGIDYEEGVAQFERLAPELTVL
nr:LLM class flavin-dependent oxidoreductase [Cryptosporangium phraense]